MDTRDIIGVGSIIVIMSVIVIWLAIHAQPQDWNLFNVPSQGLTAQQQNTPQQNTPKLTCVKYSGIPSWFHGGNFFTDSVMDCN